MSRDIVTLLYAAIGFITAALLSAKIHRDYGIYLFSYGISIAVGLLTAYWVDYFQGPGWMAVVVSIMLGCAVSLLQIPLISYFGGGLFLLISVVAHLLLVQIWIAIPTLTGGTGGLFYNTKPDQGEVYLYVLIVLSVAWYLIRPYFVREANVEQAFLRYHGPRAAIFGVSLWRHYAIPFAIWGCLTASSGVVMSRHLGFISISVLSLAGPVTLLLITAFTSHIGGGLGTVAGLSFCYLCLRFATNILGNGSQGLAVFVDVVFPASIFIMIRTLKPRDSFRRGVGNDRKPKTD